MDQDLQNGQPLVLVVIPAHNEEDTVASAIISVARAAAAADIGVHTVVVADTCSDDTAVRAVGAGADLLTLKGCIVGLSRTAGFRHGLRTLGEQPPCWMATTDADSTVPESWLRTHLQLAAAGAELVVGTVDLPAVSAQDPLRDRWLREYAANQIEGSHVHIHGANLGFTPATFEALDGFRALRHDEDVDFVRRAANKRIVTARTWLSPVTTSRRETGRTPEGFAANLERYRHTSRPDAELGLSDGARSRT